MHKRTSLCGILRERDHDLQMIRLKTIHMILIVYRLLGKVCFFLLEHVKALEVRKQILQLSITIS